jgi:superfamily II DNA/RNA helicase
VQSLSHVQNNFNFFLNSCTGSGKTLAYLVPMINGILYRQDEKSEKYPQGGVILTLNKELVAQIHR